jgi:hypothetical protein
MLFGDAKAMLEGILAHVPKRSNQPRLRQGGRTDAAH